jgi:hypothetical protein
VSALAVLRQKIGMATPANPATPATQAAMCSRSSKSSKSSNDDAQENARREYRRRRALRLLHQDPKRRYAYVADTAGEAVTLAIAVRDVGTSEVTIPHESYDPFAILLALSERGTLCELARDPVPTGPDEAMHPPARPARTPAVCRTCGGSDWWTLQGVRKCVTCHPGPTQ